MKYLKNPWLVSGVSLMVTCLILSTMWFFRAPSRELTRSELAQVIEAKSLIDTRVKPTAYAGIYHVEGIRKTGNKSEKVYLTTHLDEAQVKSLFAQKGIK